MRDCDSRESTYMLKDITLGQYYPADSVIHKLDPRVKLSATIVYIVSLFLFRSIPGFVLATAVLIALTKISGLPFRLMAKGIRAIWALIAITAFFNLFFTSGELLWGIGFIEITDTGLKNAVYFSVRLVYLILGSSILTLTTTPNKLTDGIETGLRVLNKIRIPVHEIAMMMSIALRFIPLLGDEAERIKKAQTARGADFSSGGLIRRVKSLVPILVPLFVSAFRRANDLALAMEARCYHGGEGRTKMKPLRYERLDYIAYLLTLLYLAGIIIIRIIF